MCVACTCVCLSVQILIVSRIGLVFCLWSGGVGMAIQPMNLITRHHHPSQHGDQLGPQEARGVGQEDIHLVKTTPQEPPLLAMLRVPAAKTGVPGLRNTTAPPQHSHFPAVQLTPRESPCTTCWDPPMHYTSSRPRPLTRAGWPVLPSPAPQPLSYALPFELPQRGPARRQSGSAGSRLYSKDSRRLD